MSRIKDFKGYLNDHTDGKLSDQEIAAITDLLVVVDGEEMTVGNAVEDHLKQCPGIYIYKREDGDLGRKDFLRQACLFVNFELVDTGEGVTPQITGKEIGYWVIGKGDRSSFGLAAWSGVQHHLTSLATFDSTVNNAIAIKLGWLDSDRKDQIEIVIYLA